MIGDAKYKYNIEYLEKQGWKYIGDRYTNGHVDLWCSDLSEISGDILVNINENIIHTLLKKIERQKDLIEAQGKILSKYNLQEEVELTL